MSTPVQTKLLALFALLTAVADPAVGYDAMSLPTGLKKHDIVLVAKVVRRPGDRVALASELIVKGELDRKEFDTPETRSPGRYRTRQTLLERKLYFLMLHRAGAGRLTYSKHPSAESVREVDSGDDTYVRTAVATLRLLSAPDGAARTQSLEKGWIEESDEVKRGVPYELLEMGPDEATALSGGRIVNDDQVAGADKFPADISVVTDMSLTPAKPSSGWMIRFFPDGRVHAQYGSALGDAASLPKGSIHFEALVRAAYRLKSDKRLDRRSTIAVSITDELNTAFSLTDDTLFRYLIDSFDEKWRPEMGSSRFDTLRRQYPIFRDVMPADEAHP